MFTTTATFLSDREFEQLVEKHLGITDYCFQAAEELSNDSSKVFETCPEEPYEYDHLLAKNASFWDFRTDLLVNWLCHKGVLPAGRTVIEINY